MHILLTGGLGFIGSHTAVTLIRHGYEVSILDNLSNSDIKTINSIEKITGYRPSFSNLDILDFNSLDKYISNNSFDAVIHFAALKSVLDSQKYPKLYYENNFIGSKNLFDISQNYKINKFIFSSSATVYGNYNIPIKEDAATLPKNPYGHSKIMFEQYMSDLTANDSSTNVSVLRYFNPCGADSSRLLREELSDQSSNLFPMIIKTILKKHSLLEVYGNDYDTKDGTGLRDFIHVRDLVDGHIAALEYKSGDKNFDIFNLGSGKGYTVLEVIKEFENQLCDSIPYNLVNRREGDIAISLSDITKAKNVLKWNPKLTLIDMVKDTLSSHHLL
jgi:UDP-glucose 4-epimerase